jgi:hypothetical protein
METHTQFSLRYDVSLFILRTLNLVCFRPPLTSKARVLSEISPFEVLGGQRDTGTGLLSEYFGLSLSVLFQQCYALIFKVISVL